MGYRLSADIGGTFTDLVLLDGAGGVHVHKCPSTPDDFARGILSGAARIVGDHSDLGGLDGLDMFVHGATVVLNALLQAKLPVTGLVTTDGFRDVLEIGRTNNPEMYSLMYVKPAPLVPRRRRFEVRERMTPTGEVSRALEEQDVLDIAEQLRTANVEAVAVVLLHSYANPAHERRVGEILREQLPGVAVCLSSEVAAEWGEFERSTTTCVNAATRPIIASYLARLASTLENEGLQNDLLVMQSNGGVMTADAACEWPVRTIMSGPSGGVVGALELAAAVGSPNVVTLDIGGTSSDMGVIVDGQAVTVEKSSVAEGCPILAPMIEILSIGAGGGSIVWIDGGGALRVGPQSAGALPAPVCYGRGGTDPTVTDANVVLGRIDPGAFLDGEMALDSAAAAAALDSKVAKPMGMELAQAADGVIRIVNANMAKAMRSILIERGHDPRDFVLMGFGGGGGLHTAAVMRELGIPKAIVPSNPGALSAFGMLSTDFRADRSRTYVQELTDLDLRAVVAVMRELEVDAEGAFVAAGVDRDAMTFRRSVDLRYVGQEYSLTVPAGVDDMSIEPERLGIMFNQLHQRNYGYATPESPVQLVNLRVTAIGAIERPVPLRIEPGGSAQPRPHHRRSVYFDGCGFVDTPVFLTQDARAGDRMEGPAIWQDPRSTTLVLAEQHAVVDEFGNLHIHETEEVSDRDC